MEATVVTTKGQIVIPKKIRAALHIKKGTQVRVEARDGEIILRPLTAEYFERMAGFLGTRGRATRALLRERARDRKREG